MQVSSILAKVAIAFRLLVEEVSRVKISFFVLNLTIAMTMWSDY